MAQKLVTSFISTSVPGAYPNVSVRNSPAGLTATGIVAIIGEADGGADFANEDIKNNFYSADQFDRVAAKYIRGPIVDAMRALAAPSADAGIVGGPSRVFIFKTNAGTKAAKTIDTSYGDLVSLNYGADGNKIKIQAIASQLEVAPKAISAVIPAFGVALDSTNFSLRLNGGVLASVTLSATPADHQDVAALVVELNSLLPVGITASAGVATNTIELTMAADAANYRKGWGKSLELVESTAAHLARLGLTAGQTKSAAESQIQISIIRNDINLNETLVAKGEIALEIGYQGTTATVTINATTLVTAVTGGAGASLTVTLADYTTISDLADFINSQTGYKASVVLGSAQLQPSALDKVTAIGICSSSSAVKAGRIKKSLANFKNAIANSSAVSFTAQATEGLATPFATSFLANGAKGSTSSADILNALGKMESIKTNFVVPLFSRNASDDIAENLTSSSSTYTIDAVHAATKSHCLKMSTPKLKRNRMAALSYFGTFVDSQAKSQALANFRCFMTFQKVSQVNETGVVNFQPWYAACVATGMQAAGFYRGFVNKLANVVSFTDPSGFDAGSPGDLETALDAGMVILQKDNAGIKWVSDQTTYGFDTNFVYNSIQAVYLADIAAIDIAESLERAFVGQSLADVSATSAEAFIIQKMTQYRTTKIIASSDDAVLGYKNLKISINGPVMEVSLELKLSTTLYFIPINIQISQITQSVG